MTALFSIITQKLCWLLEKWNLEGNPNTGFAPAFV